MCVGKGRATHLHVRSRSQALSHRGHRRAPQPRLVDRCAHRRLGACKQLLSGDLCRLVERDVLDHRHCRCDRLRLFPHRPRTRAFARRPRLRHRAAVDHALYLWRCCANRERTDDGPNGIPDGDRRTHCEPRARSDIRRDPPNGRLGRLAPTDRRACALSGSPQPRAWLVQSRRRPSRWTAVAF